MLEDFAASPLFPNLNEEGSGSHSFTTGNPMTHDGQHVAACDPKYKMNDLVKCAMSQLNVTEVKSPSQIISENMVKVMDKKRREKKEAKDKKEYSSLHEKEAAKEAQYVLEEEQARRNLDLQNEQIRLKDEAEYRKRLDIGRANAAKKKNNAKKKKEESEVKVMVNPSNKPRPNRKNRKNPTTSKANKSAPKNQRKNQPEGERPSPQVGQRLSDESGEDSGSVSDLSVGTKEKPKASKSGSPVQEERQKDDDSPARNLRSKTK